MAIIINNALDLYDLTVNDALDVHFKSISGVNWMYCPTDYVIPKAKERLGERIFPLYSVFRSTPALPAENSSLVNYGRAYQLGDNKSMNQLMVSLEYQLDFWCKTTQELNKSNIDWLKFRGNSQLQFDFSGLDLEELEDQDLYEVGINFEDATDNHFTDEIYDAGRYFRYTYIFTMSNALVFDINAEFPYTKIIISVYHTLLDEQNLILQKQIPED